MYIFNRGAYLKLFSRRIFFKLLNHDLVSSKPSEAAAAAVAVLPGWSSTRGYLSIIPRTRYPNAHVVDLRTDSVTKPGPAMRQAMAEAAVRSDLIIEDPIVYELQKTAADMFGMEAALFVPSGSMGNLVAIMSHCLERGSEMIVGDLSHVHLLEQGSSAQVAGVHTTTMTTLPNGTFDLDELESKIRHGDHHPSSARSRLICLENTHNIQGGRVLPLTFLQEVRALADRYGLSVHMDGARLLNAAVAQGVPPHTILQYSHSVSMCLNKGLGAPVGSMVAGSQDFITRVIRSLYALGGRMGQIGVLAAAGKVSLLDMAGRLKEDHCNAKTFAQALLNCDPPLFAVDMASVETNIVRFYLKEPSLSPSEFCALMVHVGEGEEAALGQGVQVAMNPFVGNSIRAVWHLGISPEDTQLAIQKMQFVASQYSREKLRAQ
ncbi:uncharacterized protein [Paralichthys olivaceus]|uniref:uncharacterized protein n=1 Tax=Paralichthys olivaceus TaxID=8255 RepID=UPI00097CF8FB|nr:PREDICTED: probable low-specificity L-threonine aldolase 2 [Paralichthys olivaceus]